MSVNTTKERITDFLATLPDEVILVAAAKTRTVEEVREAIKAGITIVGYNYVQEAQRMIDVFGDRVKWHLIGHLQRNKAKKAVELFDMIETVDSVKLARAVNRHCADAGKTMPVLLEVNSGRESNKSGVFPEDVDSLVESLGEFEHIRVKGLMTMGPFLTDSEAIRPFFRETRQAFERVAKLDLPNLEMRYLSMGMSSSYQVALEEGANMIRIGTKLFGPREY